MNSMKSTPRNNLIRMTEIKDEERILKATREKQPLTYKGTPARLFSRNFSGQMGVAFKMMKLKHLQPRILYPRGYH